MQRINLSAAVAVLLSVGASVAIHAESNPEIATPTGEYFVFDDGNGTVTSSFADLGYAVVDGHAITEGDIVLGQVSNNGALLNNNRRGLGQARLLDRWPNGIVPYKFSAELSETERQLTREAIAHWNQLTSLWLMDITPEVVSNGEPDGESNSESQREFENFITFETSNSCRSYVGMIGGNQQLWISESCGVGSIIHEIGHAIGLFHEHTRNDRDNFISVIDDNVNSAFKINFDILEAGTSLLGEYDYGSIMHYGNAFFSVNGEDTIEVLGDAEIGQRIALSDRDIQSVNTLYETDLSLVVDTNPLQGGAQIATDVQITNQGPLGSNLLSLEIDAGNGATWLSMSPNPDWECNAAGTKLTCKRESLESSATSLFTVTASGTSASAISAKLSAKTHETNYDNNGHNATVTAPPKLSAQSEEEPATSNPDTMRPDVDSESNVTQQPPPVINTVAVEQPSPEEVSPVAVTDSGVEEVSSVAVTGTGAVEQLSPEEESPELQAATPTQALLEASSEGSDNVDPTASKSSSGGALSPLPALSLLLCAIVIRRRRDQGLLRG